jgi:hypothetical protein
MPVLSVVTTFIAHDITTLCVATTTATFAAMTASVPIATTA